MVVDPFFIKKQLPEAAPTAPEVWGEPAEPFILAGVVKQLHAYDLPLGQLGAHLKLNHVGRAAVDFQVDGPEYHVGKLVA